MHLADDSFSEKFAPDLVHSNVSLRALMIFFAEGLLSRDSQIDRNSLAESLCPASGLQTVVSKA